MQWKQDKKLIFVWVQHLHDSKQCCCKKSTLKCRPTLSATARAKFPLSVSLLSDKRELMVSLSLFVAFFSLSLSLVFLLSFSCLSLVFLLSLSCLSLVSLLSLSCLSLVSLLSLSCLCLSNLLLLRMTCNHRLTFIFYIHSFNSCQQVLSLKISGR